MRLVIASRLSQLASGQTGIDTQDIETQRWAKANGHTIVAVTADWASGKSQPWDRPDLKPWVTRPDKIVQYDGIAAYRLDRLSRGNNESTNAIEQWAHDNRKVLLTVDGLRYPCEGTQGIQWDVTKRLAHESWLETSERYTRMHDYLKTEHKLVGRPCFGLQVVDAEGGHKTLAPSDLGRQYAPEIFAKVIANISLADIGEWLDAEDVAAPGGKGWRVQTLGTLIRNQAMMGRRVETLSDGRTAVLRFEALIDPATFRLANDALDTRLHRGPKGKNPTLMSGLLKCFRCGGPMYAIMTGRGASARLYYRCKGTGPRPKSVCANMIDVASADAIISAKMASNHAPVMETKIKPGHNHKAELADIKQQMADLPLGLLSDAEVDVELKLLRARRDELLDAEDTPDELVETPTGESYSQMWARLSDAGRHQWMQDAKVRLFGLHAPQGEDTDEAVLAIAQDPKSMFWEEGDDGEAVFIQPKPSVNGNWIYFSPLSRIRMKKAALVRPRK